MRKRLPKPRPPLPAPMSSAWVYIRITPADMAIFRFLLEAEDNLGYMSVLNRWEALLKVTCSPHQTKRLRGYLEGMREKLTFTIIGGLGEENSRHMPLSSPKPHLLLSPQ